MSEVSCRKCGSDLEPGPARCSLCDQILNMECASCDYVSENKIHLDCLNAELYLRN